MDSDQNVGGRDRLARALLAVVCSVLALRWLRAGKRGRGLLAGTGALVFGFNASTGYCPGNDALGVDTTAGDQTSLDLDEMGDQRGPAATESTGDAGNVATGITEDESTTDHGESRAVTDAQLTCAVCGEPIVPGQARGPNEHGQIVHDDCA
jgi:hypothetical protein